MKIILSFVIKEFRQLKRDKRILPILIVAPIIQLILLGYAATFDIKNIQLAVCDLDESRTSKNLIEKITSSSHFLLKYYVEDPNDIDKLFKSNQIKSAVIIPTDFEKGIYSKNVKPILFLTDGTEGTTASVSLIYARAIIFKYLKDFLNEEKREISPKIEYQVRIWYNPEMKSSNFMIPAIFALLLSIITMLIPSMSLVKEKEIGTIEQLFVTPIKPYQIILGKMTTFMLISIIDIIFVTIIAVLWFEVPLRGSVFNLFLATFLFLFTTLGIAIFFSTITYTQQQAMMSVMFLFLLPSMLLSGFIFPIENIPYFFRWISYLLPLTYFIEILRGVFLKGNTFFELSKQYTILMIIGLLIFTLSLIKFKKNIN